MTIIYQKKDIKLLDSESDKFVYSIDIYKVWKTGFAIQDSKYVASNKEILKYKSCVVKQFDGYKLIKYVEFIAAPLDYLNNNHFKKVEVYDKRELRKREREKKSKNTK